MTLSHHNQSIHDYLRTVAISSTKWGVLLQHQFTNAIRDPQTGQITRGVVFARYRDWRGLTAWVWCDGLGDGPENHTLIRSVEHAVSLVTSLESSVKSLEQEEQ
ncbi:MAG: hypothetical protein E6R03_03490 [Hyphomicrobiaceae bacterium]|nr:MAG: hypothetical protein E6R03_03490 [Hyphomicrobiaceae bacterium]